MTGRDHAPTRTDGTATATAPESAAPRARRDGAAAPARATTTHRVEQLLRRAVLFGGPLGLLVAAVFHPTVGSQGPAAAFLPVADRYLAVHLLLVPAGAALAGGLYALVSRFRGPAALVARVGSVAFGFCITVYSAIAGLAVGILATAAPRGVDQATLAPIVEGLFTSPLPVVLAMVAILSYLVAVVAVAVVLSRAGAPRPALLALVASTVGVVDHLGLTGVVGMGLYVVAAAWLEVGWSPAGDGGAVEGRPDSR